MHGVTESRPVTVRMEARPWRSGNKTTEWATKLALTRSAFSWKGRSLVLKGTTLTLVGCHQPEWNRDLHHAAPPTARTRNRLSLCESWLGCIVTCTTLRLPAALKSLVQERAQASADV